MGGVASLPPAQKREGGSPFPKGLASCYSAPRGRLGGKGKKKIILNRNKIAFIKCNKNDRLLTDNFVNKRNEYLYIIIYNRNIRIRIK